MPANLTPDYLAAEQRFREARTPDDKLAALQEMLRLLPKHKGTEKIQAGLRSRIARLRQMPRKKGPAHAAGHHIPREGAGQVVLVGPPNSGKSSLVAALTHARPEVAAYPYTTREAIPGMMAFEDILIQLVDLPPLGEEHVEPWVYEAVRRADLAWLVVDARSSLDGMALVDRLLATHRVALHPDGSEPPAGPPEGWTDRPALLVVTRADRPEGPTDLEILRGLLERPWPVLPTGSPTGAGLEELRRRTYDALDIVRVYSKQPGRPADRERPFALRRGSTVADLARTIHNDLVRGFRFARVWGQGVHDGQTVQREHVLGEGDVVEIHA